MNKRSTKSTPFPPLIQNLWTLLGAQQTVFSQTRTWQRGLALFLAELLTLARHTVTQQLLVLGLTDTDWSAFYRLFSHPQRFDVEQAQQGIFQATLAGADPTQPYVIGVDTVPVPRTSSRMPGTSWGKAAGTAAFNPGLHRQQRFLDLAWLTPLEDGYSRAIPLGWRPAFPDKAVPAGKSPACKDWEAGLAAIRWTRDQLHTAGRTRQSLWVLVDGSFEKPTDFWRGLPQGVVVLARTARNRALFELGEYRGVGRPPLYGEPAPHPADWLRVRPGWGTVSLRVRGRACECTYRVEGPYVRDGIPDHPVFLIVVRGMDRRVNGRSLRRKPVFYLVSAVRVGDQWVLPAPAEVLLTWAWQRWELEVEHRELKSGFGLGEKQCWNPTAAVVSVQWSAWVYALLLLAGYQTWGLLGGPHRTERWWAGSRRWSLNTLWRAYRSALFQAPEFRPLFPGTGSNWGQKQARITALWNAVLGAARG